jgi:cytochrome c6
MERLLKPRVSRKRARFCASVSDTVQAGGGEKLNKGYSVFMAILAVMLLCHAVPAAAASVASQGEQAFVKNCAVCHPNGGNTINSAKTLHKKDLAKSGIKKPADIIGNMRNPGPTMTRFDEAAIPDSTAKTIAEYILKTFK